jgi:hypothetical protein
MGFVTNESTYSLAKAIQRLWVDHAAWTHQYIVAAVDRRPESEEAAGRLLRNQDDIGNAIASFYGSDAGAKLTDLLKQHIMIAVDLIEAAKSGDRDRFGELDRTWTENADEIAAFLGSANPHWPQKDVADLLHLHLLLTKDSVVARLEKNYDKDVEAYDAIITEILTLAEALAQGIVRQFPERFVA